MSIYLGNFYLQQAVDSNTFKPLPQIVESKHNTSPSSLQKRADAINIDADVVQSEKENVSVVLNALA